METLAPYEARYAPTDLVAPAEADEKGVEPLGGGWIVVTVVIGVMAALIALGGMVLSFHAVSTEMVPAFGAKWAWLVPIVVDLTVFVFSGVDLVLARLDMGHPLARWTVYAATGGTVWLNYSAGGSAAGRVAHVLMPSIWVVFVELMRHVVRRQVNLATASHREPIPAARWFLSPWPTLKLWRRMVLWRVNSYPRALAAEKARLGAVATAREMHGLLWRYRISPLTRLQISLGELGPDDLQRTAAPAPAALNDPTADGRSPDRDGSTEATGMGQQDRSEAAPSPRPDESTAREARDDRDERSRNELLDAARQVELWRGQRSATQISRKLGIGMPLATSLAGALRAEDELAERTAAMNRRRSEDELLAQAREMFAGRPVTAEALRQALNIRAATARTLRDRLLAEAGSTTAPGMPRPHTPTAPDGGPDPTGRDESDPQQPDEPTGNDGRDEPDEWDGPSEYAA
jgi:hypothetical protein